MRVRFTKQAVRDLNDAYEYIHADSPRSAGAVIERIEHTIETIAKHPGIGKKGRLADTREFRVLHTPFIVVYRTHADELQILSVLHASRRYP